MSSSMKDKERQQERRSVLGPDLRQALTERLTTHPRRRLAHEGLRRAAVTLVVVGGSMPPGSQSHESPRRESLPAEASTERASFSDDGQEAAVVLTRRAPSLSQHSGQFALPGGRLDAGETAIEAALRELHEEVGLELGAEAVLGCLDDFVTRSGYHLTPVVVWGAGAGPMTANPGEVAQIFRVPLRQIAEPETHREVALDPGHPTVLALAIVGTLVFAPTAAILLQLGDLAVHGRRTPVAHHAQPRFAWS